MTGTLLHRSLPLALVAALGVSPALAGQDADTTRRAAPDSANVTLLDITIDPSANEPHVVFLQKGVVYRASFSQPGVVLRMRSYRSRQLPFIVDLTGGLDATGGSELELYPQSDGDIELTAVVPAPVPVRFRLWSDARATQRGQRSAEEGYWELGVDALLGWHDRFESDGVRVSDPGATYGACLSIRNGPGVLGPLNGCIVGYQWYTGELGKGYRSIFTEPRVRLAGGGREHRGWRMEYGAVARFEILADGDDGWNFGPRIFGFGGYAARDLRDVNGKGWRMTAVLRIDHLRDAWPAPGGGGTGEGWVPAVQFGIGRYW